MKNLLLSAAVALAFGTTTTASAQLGYSFSKLNQAYTPLSAATSVSKQSLWTADTLFTVPIGFPVKIGGTTVSTIHLAGGTFVMPSFGAVQSGFMMIGTGLMDRGHIQGVAKSDIRYATSGSSGSRIFKMEIYNAGFDDEYENNGELKDSVSIQLWLYEGSNVAEFRYGSSRVSNFSDYFGANMMSGYMKNIDTATVSFEKFYVIAGSPGNPSLDSLAGTFGNKGLSSFPPSGTVFRFTPIGNSTTGIGQVAAGALAKIYPTVCINELIIERNTGSSLSYEILSLTGQVTSRGIAGSGRTRIDLTSLAAGAYIVKLSDEEEGFEICKIVKQ